ncbi:MAG TPA: thermostable hemolysin [Methylophilaceae bacterium]
MTASKPNSPDALLYGDSALDNHNSVNQRLAQLFNLNEHNSQDRNKVEDFIRERFSATHGACINIFMPRLLSLRTIHDEMIAAIGLRAAIDGRLFLETYLNRPIESLLQERLGVAIGREEIIEVGNLSTLYPGAARWLIVAVTALLKTEGYKWVVFTGTPTLRNGFHRLGLRPVELGKATIHHLPAHERAMWGNYYDHSPMVMAGDIEHGYHSLLMQRDLTNLLRGGISSVEGDLQA